MKIVRLIAIAAACFISYSVSAQWRAAATSASINSVAVASDGTIFAGSDGGFLRSRDRGATWDTLPSPKFGGSTYPLGNVWGIASNGDVYANVGFRQAKSTNNGTDWTMVKVTPVVGTDPNFQNFSFTSGGLVVGATGTSGFFVSSDRGSSWLEYEVSSDGYDYPTAFAMSPKGTRFASTIKGTFDTMPGFVFQNVVWNSVATPPAGGLGNAASIHFNSSSEGVASGSNGVFYSSDNGHNWTQIDQNSNSAQLATTITDNGYIFEAQSFGGKGVKVLRSPTGSWEDMSGPMAGKEVYALTVGPYNRVYAASEAGMFSVDEGLTGDVKASHDGPKPFALEQNVPNPVSKTTTIHFTLAEAAPVTLKVYDFSGREISCLACANYSAGSYDVTFDVRNMAAGVYYYELHAGTSSAGRMMIVTR